MGRLHKNWKKLSQAEKLELVAKSFGVTLPLLSGSPAYGIVSLPKGCQASRWVQRLSEVYPKLCIVKLRERKYLLVSEDLEKVDVSDGYL